MTAEPDTTPTPDVKPSAGQAGQEAEPAAPGQGAVAPERRQGPKVVVPRWIQLVLLPIAILGAWALARAAGSTLLVFMVAGVIALFLNPLVKLLHRRGLPRGLAVAAVYVGFFLLLGGVGVLLANPIANQVTKFQHDVPNIVNQANHTVASFQSFLNKHGVHVQIQHQGENALQTLQRTVLKGSGHIVSFTSNLLQQIVSVGFSAVLVLVISIYMLLYGDQIGALVKRIMPPGDGTPDDDYPLLVQRAVFEYARAQALFSAIMGASAGLALWLLGVVGVFPAGQSYGLFFGVFYGVMELVPYVGPVIGAIPPVLVALFQHPLTAVWVILLFVVLQQLEGHVVAPQVFGRGLRINPILVIFTLLIGADLYGIVGALIALPVISVLRETVIYLRRHLVLEPWGGPWLLSGPAPTAPGVPARLPPGAGPAPPPPAPGQPPPPAAGCAPAPEGAETPEAAEPDAEPARPPRTPPAGPRVGTRG
jgi:predicted PurR-regulated permease PerM